MSYTVKDAADVVRHIIDTNMVLANLTADNPNIISKPIVKKFKKLLTVNPQTQDDNYVRTSLISKDMESTDLNFDHRTTIQLVDVQLDAAIDTSMIPLEDEVLRAIDQSRLLPLGSDRSYHFVEVIFEKNSSTFKTEQEQRNYTVKLTSVSKPITV